MIPLLPIAGGGTPDEDPVVQSALRTLQQRQQFLTERMGPGPRVMTSHEVDAEVARLKREMWK